LPEIKAFAAFLGRLGITPETRVFVYDDKGGANAAARFWWMLKSLGHKTVQVIDGGWEAIQKHGLPTSTKAGTTNPTLPYPAESWMLPMVAIDKVEHAASDQNALVIDVREGYRYRGEREPIDLVAGHIPGAINVPYLSNLAPDGFFLPASVLAEQYNEILDHRDPSKVVVHCGSGVTACHTLLALEQAGIQGANLYVGSWSEWSRRDKPVGKGS
jgi:thiosulfate/3-mercaptopyruvate sulfurtransferase